jgi:streptomycin 3"-adenylyltransferase
MAGVLTPSEEGQLAEVVALVDEVLGPAALGSYLFGSAASGGLKPESDLDVLTVSARRLTLDEKRRLGLALVELSRGADSPPGTRRLELTVLVGSEVRPWPVGRMPRFDFQYGNWLRDDFLAGRFEPWAPENPDVGTLVTMALLHGRALAGPPAADLLEPPPREELGRLMLADLPSLLADLDTDTRNVLLTLARIWTTLATGKIRSKDGAADWALVRLPVELREPMARAREGYLGVARDPWESRLPAVHATAAWIVWEIDRLS